MTLIQSCSLRNILLTAGALFIRLSQDWLSQFEDVKFEGLQGANAKKTLLLVAVMAAHALGEGSGVGVSFCGHKGWAQVRHRDKVQPGAYAELRSNSCAVCPGLGG